MVLPCRLLAHYLALDFCCEHVQTLGFERSPQNNALGPRTRCLSKRHFWGCVRIWLIIRRRIDQFSRAQKAKTQEKLREEVQRHKALRIAYRAQARSLEKMLGRNQGKAGF